MIDHSAALEGSRQSWKLLFSLAEVLLAALCGTLAGAEDLVEVRRWSQVRLDFLRRSQPFEAGVPSHDTLNDAIDRALVTIGAGHGRIAIRRHLVSHDVGWLTTARRHPGEPRFPGLRAIAVVEAEVERNGHASLERRHHLSSMPLDAKLAAHAARCHWRAENRLRWVARRRASGGSQPAALRPRATAHGDRPAHGDEPAARAEGQARPESPPSGTPPTSRHCSGNQSDRRSSDSPGPTTPNLKPCP